MKKIIVVRQNHCDREMRFLFFLLYSFFFALQVLNRNVAASGRAQTLAQVLFCLSGAGFLFTLGYRWHAQQRLEEEQREENGRGEEKAGEEGAGKEKAGVWIRRCAVCCFACFFCLTFLSRLLQYSTDQLLGDSTIYLEEFSRVLLLLETSPVSAVFFSMALALAAAGWLGGKTEKAVKNNRILAAVTAALWLTSLLGGQKQAYVLTASLFGSSDLSALPGVPYFAYFLLGAWIEEKKPGFSWNLAAGSAIITAGSILLWATPLRLLAQTGVWILPLYLIYVLSELLSELTQRVPAAKAAVDLVLPASFIYVLLVFGLGLSGWYPGAGAIRTVLTGAALLLAFYAAAALFVLFCRCYQALERFIKTRVRHKTAAYFLIYTLVFSFLLFLVFFDFLLRGRTFIILGDGVSQYYPRAVYFARYIRELFSNLLSGNFQLPMYDFSIGLGAEITYSLEPLYFLFALFPEDKMEFAYNLITVLRFYLAGISCSALCLYFRKGYYPSFLASVVYVICGFALYAGTMHTFFMIPMIMLPLLIMAVEEILRRGKWYLCPVFTAISLLGNYYFLYMNTIAMGIYFLVRFFCQKEKTKRTVRNFFGRGLTLCGSYLLGVGMSCLVLVTTFGMYLGSGRTDAVKIKTPSLFFYREGWLSDCFMTFLTVANSPGEWLKLGYLPIALFALLFLFLRKGKKELKIFSILCGIFIAFPLFGFIFSGFSAVINRWCYMISLVLAFLVADGYRDMLRLTRREKKVFLLVTLLYGFLAFFGVSKNTGFTKTAFFTLLLTFAVLLLVQEANRKLSAIAKKSLMFFLTAGLVFYAGMSIYELGGRYQSYATPGYAQESELDTPLQVLADLEDESFYRAAALKLDYYTSNAPMLLDYNSITMICSTLNGNVMEYLEQNGCISYSITQFLGFNNRGYLSSLASVKYYVTYGKAKRPVPYGYTQVMKTKTKDGKTVRIYENQYALPLGYTYDSAITEEQLEEYDVLERQEVMMQKAVLDDEELAEQIGEGEEALVTAQALTITRVKEKNAVLTEHELIAGAGDAGTKQAGTYKVTLKFEAQPNSELYLVLHGAYLEGDMSEDSIGLVLRSGDSKLSYSFKADDDRYHTGQTDFVFNLGYFEEAPTSLSITMKREGVIHFESLTVYSQPMENTALYTSALTEDVLEQTAAEDGQISGVISLEEDKLLVLSIPYQNGWSAWVDGEKTELKRVNYAYMGLALSAGEHTIELRFTIPGVWQALVIMPASFLLFLLLCLIRGVRKRKRSVQQKENGQTM